MDGAGRPSRCRRHRTLSERALVRILLAGPWGQSFIALGRLLPTSATSADHHRDAGGFLDGPAHLVHVHGRAGLVLHLADFGVGNSHQEAGPLIIFALQLFLGHILVRVMPGDADILVQRLADLHVKLVALPAQLDRLVDQIHRRAHRHKREQLRDVLVIKPHATVGHAHADAVGLGCISAMNQVTGDPEAHGEFAQGIVGTGRDHVRQGIALGRMLALDRGRRRPRGILLLVHHRRLADRRAPVHAAHADRVGNDFAGLGGGEALRGRGCGGRFGRCRRLGARGILGGRAGGWRGDRLFRGGRSLHRIVIQAHLRNVDDDARPGRVGQDVLARQQNTGALLGQPAVNGGIGHGHLILADAVAAGDVDQRVLVMRRGVTNLADEIVAAGRHAEGFRAGQPGAAGQRQGNGQPCDHRGETGFRYVHGSLH